MSKTLNVASPYAGGLMPASDAKELVAELERQLEHGSVSLQLVRDLVVFYHHLEEQYEHSEWLRLRDPHII